MLTNEFHPNENLFRAIKPIPNWWDEETNRPTSAAFKDSNGASIDRQGERVFDECKNALLDRFKDLKAIVHISSLQSISQGGHPFYEPVDGNVYHSLLKQADGTIPLTSSIAKKISRNVEVCHLKQE